MQKQTHTTSGGLTLPIPIFIYTHIYVCVCVRIYVLRTGSVSHSKNDRAVSFACTVLTRHLALPDEVDTPVGSNVGGGYSSTP